MHIAPCSFDATKYAVMRWHYSKTMPSGKLFKLGVWDGPGAKDRYDGAIVYGRGASANLYKSFDASFTELVELTRVALRPQADRDYPTSKAIGFSLRMLARENPGLGVIFSFADWGQQQHMGTIYQATNWWFIGMTKGENKQFLNRLTGQTVHSRTVKTWRKNDPRRLQLDFISMPKLRYVYPLNDKWKRRLASLRQPYPIGPSALEPSEV